MRVHYSRKERLSMSNAPGLSTRNTGGIFKGNRSLLIVLLDILLLVLMIFIFKQFIFSPSYQANLAGYRIDLRGYPVENGIMVVIRLAKKVKDAPEGRAFLHVFLGKEEARESLLLPLLEDEPSELKMFLSMPNPEKELKATVRIGEEQRTLRWIMERER